MTGLTLAVRTLVARCTVGYVGGQQAASRS
jgi:hypothetical protein